MLMLLQFLCLVSNEDMVGALRVCDQILEFEPTNSMMKDYKRSLQIYVQQGKDCIRFGLQINQVNSTVAMDEREGEEDSDEEEEVEDGEEDEDDEDEEDDEEEPDRGAKS